MFPDGFSKVLDSNEFKAHCEQYHYSEDLQKILRSALEKIRNKVANKEDPFNEVTVKNYLKDYEDFVAKQELKDKKEPH